MQDEDIAGLLDDIAESRVRLDDLPLQVRDERVRVQLSLQSLKETGID